jgi:predicted transcriptional regulator
MTASTTLTIRVPVEVKERLGRISAASRRSQSYLAAEALTAYVDRELAIIEGILQGMEEIRAGKGIPHDVVMAEARAIIDEARKRAA